MTPSLSSPRSSSELTEDDSVSPFACLPCLKMDSDNSNVAQEKRRLNGDRSMQHNY
jgi:hypothetical protein